MKLLFTLYPPVIRCSAYSEDGNWGIGEARCHPDDIWDEGFGRRLAKRRALVDYHQRDVKTLLLQSRDNRKHKNFRIAEDMLFDYGYELDDIGINLIAKILDNAKIAKRIKL